ncbi:MAG: hypothetical protein K2O66_04565, partial [Bacteroidales bacterium]|nr:hypothetical protein [Bacteroidales bacterium]
MQYTVFDLVQALVGGGRRKPAQFFPISTYLDIIEVLRPDAGSQVILARLPSRFQASGRQTP